jgi:type IV pilus assembly protein PilW
MSRRSQQRGFSLVELMVGVVVALIAVIVVMQVFQLSEGQRRNTTGGDDAQTSGAIAMNILQRDLLQAGNAVSNEALLGCNLALPSGNTINNLSGVTINHPGVAAGDANTDTLLVVYGNGNGLPDGSRVASVTGSVYRVSSPLAFRRNDWVVASPALPRIAACGNVTLTQVTLDPAGDSVTVGAAGATGNLHNWGDTPVVNAYAVRNGQLSVCDYRTRNCSAAAAANWTPIAEGVVSLRAQYGVDTDPPPRAVNPTVESYDQTTPTTVCGWLRRPAIRLALVLRSGQYDRDYTAPTPTWAGSANAPLTLSGTDWQRYRYKTFETTVPLRNVSWQPTPTPTC